MRLVVCYAFVMPVVRVFLRPNASSEKETHPINPLYMYINIIPCSFAGSGEIAGEPLGHGSRTPASFGQAI